MQQIWFKLEDFWPNFVKFESFFGENTWVSDPWEHLLGMGLGVVFVNQLVKWDAKLQVDLDKMLEKAKAANERRYFGPFSLNFNFFLAL